MNNFLVPPKTKEEISGDVSSEIYRTLMEYGPICTIDVLFFNSGKTHTLLGKRTNEPYKGTFFAFGGRLRKHESFENAAIRIAKQETGIDLAPYEVKLAGIINEINNGSKFKGTDYHAVDIYFACIVPEDIAIKLDPQHNEYRWFEVDDKSLHPNITTRIKSALEILK